LRDVLISIFERHNVRNIRPTPLVNCLVVVADDDQISAPHGLREQLNEALLRWIYILILVDDEMCDLAGRRGMHGRILEDPHSLGDLLAERQYPIPCKCLVIELERVLEIAIWDVRNRDQLVLDY